MSVLENAGQRIGAAMVVLTSLDGDVIAASGSHVKAGTQFLLSPEQRSGAMRDGATSVRVDGGRIYQLVTVPVRSPLPVAWIAMGFELDAKQVRELADLTGLAVTLSVSSDGHWTDLVSAVPTGEVRSKDVVTRRIALSRWGNASVVATLSRSLADARAPFERLTKVLYLIAAVSFVASALAALWLARNITRPLQDLTRAVDQMRGGTYDVALRVARRDELGVLAEGLQLMQSAVQSRDQSIRRLAYEDTLTGLMNRTAFVGALSQALSANRSRVAVADPEPEPLPAHQRASSDTPAGRRRADRDRGPAGRRADGALGRGAPRRGSIRGVHAARGRRQPPELGHLAHHGARRPRAGRRSSRIDISVTLGLALAGPDGAVGGRADALRGSGARAGRCNEKRALAVGEETLQARSDRSIAFAARRAAPRRRAKRAAAVLPAQDRALQRPRQRRRGAAPVAASDPRAALAGGLHPLRRCRPDSSAG